MPELPASGIDTVPIPGKNLASSNATGPCLVNAFDVLALPSRTTASWKEQFGRVIIEAHACAIPVIGSTSGADDNDPTRFWAHLLAANDAGCGGTSSWSTHADARP